MFAVANVSQNIICDLSNNGKSFFEKIFAFASKSWYDDFGGETIEKLASLNLVPLTKDFMFKRIFTKFKK